VNSLPIVVRPQAYGSTERAVLERRARRLAWGGNVWHVAEFAIALAAGIAFSFFLLAAYVAVESVRTLAGSVHPEASWVGIGLAAVTAPTMPLLARAKRRVGHRLGSAATVAEGAQNLLCAYLSVALLAGLGANAFLGWWWADPLAGLAIAAVAVREGLESWRGRACADGCC
jgi:divalent metal cation (Fe/Co/Zn/Cd) transporter